MSVELVPLSELPPLLALANAGIEPRLAESIVAEAETQLRVFDPDEPFVNQVRDVLAAQDPDPPLHRPRYRRRVIALVGPPEAGRRLRPPGSAHAHVAWGGASSR